MLFPQVFPTLTDLMHWFTSRSEELDCPLRVFIDPEEPINLQRAVSKETKSKSAPFSWCQVC